VYEKGKEPSSPFVCLYTVADGGLNGRDQQERGKKGQREKSSASSMASALASDRLFSQERRGKKGG